MNRTIALIICIVVIVSLGVYKTSRHDTIAPTIETPSSYFCVEGVLKATYDTTNVTLRLLDGRTVTLSQTISGSGVRYENENMVFVTKGDYGTLSEGNTALYNDCILGTDEANTFINASHRFSFRHTNDMTISGGSAMYDTNWRNNTTTFGQRFIVGTVEQDAQPKTNFSRAIFTIGTSSDPQAMHDCIIATNGEQPKGEIVINSIIYNKFTLIDAGAGNYYNTTSYRALRDGQCYAIEYTIHSTNIANYDPAQGIEEFNMQAIGSILELAARSVTFLPK